MRRLRGSGCGINPASNPSASRLATELGGVSLMRRPQARCTTDMTHPSSRARLVLDAGDLTPTRHIRGHGPRRRGGSGTATSRSARPQAHPSPHTDALGRSCPDPRRMQQARGLLFPQLASCRVRDPARDGPAPPALPDHDQLSEHAKKLSSATSVEDGGLTRPPGRPDRRHRRPRRGGRPLCAIERWARLGARMHIRDRYAQLYPF